MANSTYVTSGGKFLLKKEKIEHAWRALSAHIKMLDENEKPSNLESSSHSLSSSTRLVSP